MSHPEEVGGQNKREYSRVKAHLPLEIRVILPEEKNNLQSRVDKKATPFLDTPNDVDDPQLGEWLRFLNAKLDTILRYLDKEHENTGNMVLTPVLIGGGGFSFTSREPYALTDTLEVKMLLPSATPLLLYLCCEVVKSEERTEGYFTALRYILIDDSIRDKILRFVFEKERELLRAKRRG